MEIEINSKATLEQAIIAIAQELMKRAKEISNDVDSVTTVDIHAVLTPGEVANFDVKKNYIAYFEPTKKAKSNL